MSESPIDSSLASMTPQSRDNAPLSSIDWLLLLVVGVTPLAVSRLSLLPANIWEHHPFHAVVEGLGSFAAVIVAVAMVMLMRQRELPRAYVWVISGLIGMGMLDGFHAATHAGHVFVWLHSTATFVGGLLFACIWIPDHINRKLDLFAIAMLTFAIATIFAVSSIMLPDLLPVMKNDDGFTFVAKALNVGGGIGFLAAAGFFVFRQRKTQHSLLFANLSVLFGVAGIIFEQSVLWDSNWWLWHILRLAAYGAVLYFFMSIYYRTLLNLRDTHLRLKQKVDQVSLQEAETHQARNQLETILNSTADAIISVDNQGSVCLYNLRAEQLFGYRQQDIVGKPVAQLFTPESRRKHERLLAEFRDDKRVEGKEHELEGQRAGAESFPVALRMTKMTFGEEQLFVELLQDVTIRKRAEAERNRLFDAIRETVNHLTTASAEISATMASQSQGAESQASKVSDMMSVVEEGTRTGLQSNSLAKDVAETARRANEVGKTGRRAIEDTRNSMNAVQQHVESTAENILTLAERAQAIGEIIAAVNDIAEQTNVLALNAAVEASRAGDAGRGFAVVAAEVKSLAEQAKKATEQVRNILSEIQQATNNAVLSTEQGSRSMFEANHVVASTEETIDELGTMVSEAARISAEIVAASSQQSTNMNHVANSVQDIDGTAKRSLVATRQTLKAAEELNVLGQRLKDLIDDRL